MMKKKACNVDLSFDEVVEVVRKTSSQEEAIKKALELVTDKFKGYRFSTYLYFWKAFEFDPDTLWQREGDFMHCHHQNLLVKSLLVKSGWFKEREIRNGYSLVWYVSPHIWLRIKLNGNWVAVDPWNYRYGAKWNEYAGGFGFRSLEG